MTKSYPAPLPVLAVLLLALLSTAARASSPGMTEGPPGCDWTATVTEVSADGLTLHLDKMQGTCMYEPGNCGKEGDTVTVPRKDAEAGVKTGDSLHVWVDGGAQGLQGNLKHPDCTRTPVVP